jgi:hypothetical protein
MTVQKIEIEIEIEIEIGAPPFFDQRKSVKNETEQPV